jgi:hypothetical protein
MKATVSWIMVFPAAFWAHFESGHRCHWPIVGNAADYSEAWAAVSAIGKRIAKPAVVRVGNIGGAPVADCRIRWD